MSSSSTPEETRRGQTTPVVALVALFAVCAGVSLYATALDGVAPTGTGTGTTLAEPTLERVYDAVADGGVVSPVGLHRAERVAPDGHRVAVAVVTDDGRWTTGRRPPAGSEGVDTADRTVAVSTADSGVVWGRLRVWVWR